MSGEEYKPIHRGGPQPPKPHEEISAIANEISNTSLDLAKLRDPVVQGSLMHKLAEERENSNRLLSTILQTLETRLSAMDARLAKLEQSIRAIPQQDASAHATEHETLLPSVDEEIMSYVRSKGRVCAEDVRVNFGYKGKNAASSRLNHLFELGVLEKRQAGRVVYYRAK